jgi:hypothetical protein
MSQSHRRPLEGTTTKMAAGQRLLELNGVPNKHTSA